MKGLLSINKSNTYKPLERFETSILFSTLFIHFTARPLISITCPETVSNEKGMLIFNTSEVGFGKTATVEKSKLCELKGIAGKAIMLPPEANATHNPKAGPSLLTAGFKKPLATTVNAAHCNPKVFNGALYLATVTVPVASLTSKT